MAALTVRRSASTPRRWPSSLGSPRLAAQRPLPSMMIATWHGTAAAPSDGEQGWSFTLRPARRLSTTAAPSDLHDLVFLGRERGVDLGDNLVRGLLHVAVMAGRIVLGDGLFLLELLDLVH